MMLTAGVVAGGSALLVATELLALERETALGAEVDQVAPQIQIVPAGVSATALARNDLGGRSLAPGAGERARRVVGPDGRLVEEALVPDQARRDQVRGGGGAANLVRVYLRPGASPRSVEARLRAALPEANVIRVFRGEVADAEMPDFLLRHRSFLHFLIATAVAICLLLAAHQDAGERRLELATLVAIGGTSALVFAVLTLRSAFVGAVGGGAGFAAGAAALIVAGGAPAAAEVPASLMALAVAGPAILAAASAWPTALRSARRDAALGLQEGAA